MEIFQSPVIRKRFDSSNYDMYAHVFAKSLLGKSGISPALNNLVQERAAEALERGNIEKIITQL